MCSRQLFYELRDGHDPSETAAQGILSPLAYGIDVEFFAGVIPVGDRECHRGIGDEVHRVSEVRRNSGGGFAALLHLDARDSNSPDAFFEQIRLQRRTGEAITSALEQNRFIGARLDEVHQLEERAVRSKALVAVGVQEEYHR